MSGSETLGVVVIGRNEGERLTRCLASVRGRADGVVYVDSGSTDDSVERARALGASTVELDSAEPFTAARGRNAGFERLARALPDLAWVQFVDGDCELRDGWLEAGRAALEAQPDVGAVCGRRRERHPEASRWNRLVDLEWDTPPGEAAAAGGDVLMRAAAFRAAGGYDVSLIAGEDPDMGRRLRRAGFRILRLEREMTWHDAALLHVGQWWRRQVRAGYAYAELAYRHRERHTVRRLASSLWWAAALPGVALLAAPFTRGAGLLLLAGLALPWRGAYRAARGRHRASAEAAGYATACLTGKLAEVQGALRFGWFKFVRRRASRLIEYKERRGETSNGSPAPPASRGGWSAGDRTRGAGTRGDRTRGDRTRGDRTRGDGTRDGDGTGQP